ncbi:hypothetical protein ACHAXS_007002, partial [Conticribra weissflogii]
LNAPENANWAHDLSFHFADSLNRVSSHRTLIRLNRCSLQSRRIIALTTPKTELGRYQFDSDLTPYMVPR